MTGNSPQATPFSEPEDVFNGTRGARCRNRPGPLSGSRDAKSDIVSLFLVIVILSLCWSGCEKGVSRPEQGDFDVTFAGAGRLWDFKHPDKPVPTRDELARAVRLVNYRELVLDEQRQTACLTRPGMKIGLGTVAKGFAADRAMTVLREQGFVGSLVDAWGDVLAAGSKHGEP